MLGVILIKAAQLIFVLSIIVTLHELGHYAAARFFNTKVERFFLFFDPYFAIFKKKIGDTVYGIGWLPLGGYVKIAGMIDESMDKEQMKKPPQPWEFRSKPAWQRLIIMLAGIIVNLLLAFFIYATINITQGETYVDINKLEQGVVVDSAQMAMGMQPGDIPVAVNGTHYEKLNDISRRALIEGGTLTVKRGNETVDLNITEDVLVSMLELKGQFFVPDFAFTVGEASGGAAEAGIEKGDKITQLNGIPIAYWGDFKKAVKANKGKEVTVVTENNSETQTYQVQISEEGIFGIRPMPDTENMKEITSTKTYGFFEGLGHGVTQTFSTISDQVESFSVLWKLKGKATKYVAGPIGIAKQMQPEWDWGFIWRFTALFSAWLAFLNILPIPGLDGGHATFTIYEMITGHKPGDKFMEIMQIVGVVILLSLMAFVFGNDIVNLIYN